MERYKWAKGSGIYVTFFAAAVIIAVIYGATQINYYSFKKNAVPVTAVISNIETYKDSDNETQYRVYIQYEYNGDTFEDTLGYWSAGMAVGKEIQIYVNPDNPTEIKSNSVLLAVLLSIFIIVFGGIGGVGIIGEIKMSRCINRLIREDKYVFAEYLKDEYANISVNDVRYIQPVFVYDDGFDKKLYFSGPAHHPDKPTYGSGDSVRVYVDIDGDTQKYYVSRNN